MIVPTPPTPSLRVRRMSPLRDLLGRLGDIRRQSRRTSGWGGLLYIIPALVLLLLFELWPIIFSVWISFWQWDVRPVKLIGLDNYARIFGDGFVTTDYNGERIPGEVLNSLLVTLYYVILTVPPTILLAFPIAYLLFRGIRGQSVWRTLYFLPYVTASVAVALVFSWIFNPRIGIANALLDAMGLPAQTWLQDPNPALSTWLAWTGFGWLRDIPDWVAGPSVALVVVAIFTVWSTIGYSIVVYLAGLTAIPKDIADAARIDGAGEWTIIRSIIWPLVSPSTFFLVIVNTIAAFQAFTPIYTLTRSTGLGRAEAGGPLDTTLTITVYVFRNFYERANSVGYAAAVSLLLFVMLLVLTVLQFRLYGRSVHYQ